VSVPSNHAQPRRLEDFYQANYPRLVGQLTVVTGSLEDAEDAVQEAFTRASTRWARLRDYDAPEAWVRRVALNLATTGLRRARRQLAVLARVPTPTAEPPRSTDRLAIDAGLRRLPLRHRQVLVLHYGADLPVEQVAQQLGLPTAEELGPSLRWATATTTRATRSQGE
jgi:RNA polymerase sigma-70 factor, ECF subfamily